jgi:hypothetical protein
MAQLLKHAELLDDRERRVIRKHYATGADAQARGSGSYVCDQDRRRGVGQPRSSPQPWHSSFTALALSLA